MRELFFSMESVLREGIMENIVEHTSKTIFFRRIICTMGKMPDGSDENAYFIRSSEAF